VTPIETRLRAELQGRRERLVQVAAVHPEERLVELLRQVDAALERLETPGWGLCKHCHDPIESDRLRADPLLTVCLDCLSPAERRALEHDLNSAARVQRALLPRSELARDGWQVAWLWEPRGAVSGDYVDLLEDDADGGNLDLLLGDVAGKGVAASLLQSHLHALFRALAEPPRPLGEILSRANRLLCQATGPASYATLVAGRLADDGTLHLANAGHPRPLLADRRGVRPVEGAGLPLGLFREAAYEQRQLRLAPGDTLLLYTDGWTEAASAKGEYGVGRAAAALSRAVGSPLPELLASCRDDMDEFLEAAERPDDLTLLAVRRVQASPE
jgi:sigma-B regulation protein RsbU (phosphoserine phosphatase)